MVNSKSTAIDGLDTYSIKIAANIIRKPVHHLITLSNAKGLSFSIKLGKVIPLHIKDDVITAKIIVLYQFLVHFLF